jgi:hypothetical protein
MDVRSGSRRRQNRARRLWSRVVQRRPAPEPPLAVSHPDIQHEAGFVRAFERCRPFTMTSPERMYALWQAVRYVHRAGIPGDYVECGVWRGGSSMLAALSFAEAGDSTRKLWLYDTYAGMSEPTDRDRAFDADEPVSEDWEERKASADPTLAYASLEEVRRNMLAVGVDADRVEFVVGKVEDTLPARAPASIGLLRLDTDWYESTRHELEHLYPRLSPGGVLIVDDYGHWAGAREAVDEYFADGEAPLMTRIDYTGRLAVKR